MGCDIHSFVMVPSRNTGFYKPIVGYTYCNFDHWRTIQPYDDRYYEMFGLLTAGCCRGSDYSYLGINPHTGRFNKLLVDPATIDPNVVPEDYDSSTKPLQFNTIAIDYFKDNSDTGLHTHGWVSLADLKRFKRLITRQIKCESTDDEMLTELQYLKTAIKKVITNTTAILNYQWEEDVDDAQVIVCFCFDS